MRLDRKPISAYFVWALGCVVALALSAQAPQVAPRELLNSERIEQTFGSYGIEVLSSTEELRVSRLYSTHGAVEVCRTFAVVAYPRSVHPSFAAEHAAILAGGSIGSTFSSSGWRVVKTHRYMGEIDSTPRVVSLMGGIEPGKLAVHVYGLRVVKDEMSFHYASIVEVHHPEYLRLGDLREIYGPVPVSDGSDEEVRRLLERTAGAMR